ncbi:hypothetical protein LAJ19_10140 [Deinococcus taeanensis]|uniref:hypothetical protein n=1 Tax=Deinococcus taeanensis TaxID=2737050 RepID=UPI001CDD7825|nr:hypothetical protein [Deinococcus taeanensis]UBV41998.1 hypothetical protein LAJ19_10140 [Deinococcus taeanensis]
MTVPHGRWRALALTALWVLVAATFALCAYSLWRAWPADALDALRAGRTLLAGVVLVWWTQVFTRYTRPDATPVDDGVLRSLRGLFPWLTSLRLALWALTLLLVTSAPLDANPVAVTALITVELAFILSKNAVYGTLARVAPNPLDQLGRAQLRSWLNVAAALSLAIGVVNVVPVAGLSGSPALTDLIVYGAHALLDVTATLLALKAVQTTPGV